MPAVKTPIATPLDNAIILSEVAGSFCRVGGPARIGYDALHPLWAAGEFAMNTLSRRSVLGGMAAGSLLMKTGRKSLAHIAEAHKSEFAALPCLDTRQSGYLRHFRNIGAIGARLPGEFAYMQANDPDNLGDYTGYRWQLQAMMDAMTLAYRNYLPAAPGVFKSDYQRLLGMLLRRECWNYWHDMSRFYKTAPPPGVPPGRGWWDPIVKGNIYYSGILTAMVAQYAYYFNDDKYDQMGALTFDRPMYAVGPLEVGYSLASALDVLYQQFVASGYLGVCCMPDMVFNSCNQFAIRAFNYQDRRKGTARAAEVTAAHLKAWRRLGGYIDGKPMPCVWLERERKVLDIPWEPGYFVFNTWNPEYFQSTYTLAKATAVRKASPTRLEVYGPAQYAETEKAFLSNSPQPAVSFANNDGQAVAGPQGTVAVLMSEAGDPDLDLLMRQVDAYLSPTWKDGGLYYPRRDADWDEAGNVIGVAPTSSHAYALARINRRNGLHDLFAIPMLASQWEEPYVAETSEDVDVGRAVFLSEQNKLVLLLRPPHATERVTAELSIANVKRQGQSWTLTADGKKLASGTPSGEVRSSIGKIGWQADRLQLALPVTRSTNVVLSWT